MTDIFFRQDTIVAQSTSPGRGAIGILRLSGSSVLDILSPHWKGRDLRTLSPRYFTLGHILDRESHPLDEALLVLFNAPHSYTGEDMAELHCHGNPFLLADIQRVLCQAGARIAEPGEFTFRAFRNGRMTFTQAESVADLIEARGAWARRNALSVLVENGDAWIRELLDQVINLWVPIEADIEFPTEGIDALAFDQLLQPLQALENRIVELLQHSTRYARLQEGFRVVLAGKPNAGKSSLLNALLGYNRALVTDIPGTTRDTLEEQIEINGIPVRLIDTAGLGEARDVLDAFGMERSRKALSQADLILLVLDSTCEDPSEATKWGLEWIQDHDYDGQTPILTVAAKCDLLSEDSGWKTLAEAVLVSSLSREGLDHLSASIAQVLQASGVVNLDERVMLNQRQESVLQRAREAVQRARSNAVNRFPQELIATDLAEARSALEELSGQNIQVDLLGTIFSRFCLGK
ncbi:MAG: tRNA uridine-5-carboxymethylaminomethyl(34) synthesis GTPase MnmE [Candidatus Omnitrophica bacterium COP1]|nr:tRNA uridine-5-carboxymethylaminomethyl(34) synthesis GTPase MnmE [Candidatus Omnitrophica bacterium COP1]